MEEIAIYMNEMLITLTSDIVAAHVSNNIVAVDDVPVLIRNVFGALSGLGGEVVKEVAPPEPAVAIRNSVKRSHIVCLDCGKKMKMLKRHLMTEHGMTPDEYRARWSRGTEYPLEIGRASWRERGCQHVEVLAVDG